MLTDTIVVTATSDRTMAEDGLTPPEQIALPADAVAIAARTPGGALIGNGALSGQLSYRGLAGERILGRVNGQRFATGGPNAMDPPLHYAPSILVDRIEIARGVPPVSQGPALAGAVNAQLAEVEFTDSAAASPQARATFADADTSTAEASLRFGTTRSYVQLGADAELTDKFVTITNPANAAFFIDAQPNGAMPWVT